MAETKKKTTEKVETPVKKVEAKKEVNGSSVSYNEENKTMAILSCLPYVSIILFFIEDDEFVKYTAAQYSLVGITPIATILIAWIPCIGQLIALAVLIGVFVAVIYGMVQISKGKVVHLPVYKDLAVKLMNSL